MQTECTKVKTNFGVLVLVFYIANIAATFMFLKLAILSEHIIHCCSYRNIFTHAYWLIIQGHNFCTVCKLGFPPILMYVEWEGNVHTIITDDMNNKNKIFTELICTEKS